MINEVLAFQANKMKVMDEESMIRICCTAFKPDAIQAAKNFSSKLYPQKD